MLKFNLEHQYQQYLDRVNITEAQMGQVQRVETRRAFMAGCSQMLVLLRDDLTELDEDEAVDSLQDMIDQSADFWKKEAKAPCNVESA
jgi:hypothetical protein